MSKSAEDFFKNITAEGDDTGASASGDEVPVEAGTQETAVSESPEQEAAEPPAEEASETPQEESAEQVQGEAAEPPQAAQDAPAGDAQGQPAQASEDPENRLRSWEGRLKAREQELAAREAALNDRDQQQGGGEASQDLFDYAEMGGDDEGGEADENIAPAQAKAKMAEYFGPEIPALIVAITRGVLDDHGAGKGVDRSELDALVGRLADLEPAVSGMGKYITRQHRSAMLAAHNDVDEVTGSQEFAQWLSTLAPEQQEKAIDVIREGSWPETVQLIADYKDAKQGAGAGEPDIDMDGIAAASGVQSQGAVRPTGGGPGGGMSAEEIFKQIAAAQG